MEEVADDEFEAIGHAEALRRPGGLGQHRGGRIEGDHVVAMARELDGDAPAARAQLDDRPGRVLAQQDVEGDVVVDPGAPAIVERAELLVGLTARCCCSCSHTR